MAMTKTIFSMRGQSASKMSLGQKAEIIPRSSSEVSLDCRERSGRYKATCIHSECKTFHGPEVNGRRHNKNNQQPNLPNLIAVVEYFIQIYPREPLTYMRQLGRNQHLSSLD